MNGGSFPFPVTAAAADDRLPAGELVLGVEIDGEARAYPIAALGDAAINDELGGEPIVILSQAQEPVGAAYRGVHEGERLTFEAGPGGFVDVATGSVWTVGGEATVGPLAGGRLAALPVRTAFWFSYVAAFPETSVYVAPQ